MELSDCWRPNEECARPPFMPFKLRSQHSCDDISLRPTLGLVEDPVPIGCQRRPLTFQKLGSLVVVYSAERQRQQSRFLRTQTEAVGEPTTALVEPMLNPWATHDCAKPIEMVR